MNLCRTHIAQSLVVALSDVAQPSWSCNQNILLCSQAKAYLWPESITVNYSHNYSCCVSAAVTPLDLSIAKDPRAKFPIIGLITRWMNVMCCHYQLGYGSPDFDVQTSNVTKIKPARSTPIFWRRLPKPPSVHSPIQLIAVVCCTHQSAAHSNNMLTLPISSSKRVTSSDHCLERARDLHHSMQSTAYELWLDKYMLNRIIFTYLPAFLDHLY